MAVLDPTLPWRWALFEGLILMLQGSWPMYGTYYYSYDLRDA